MKTLIIPKILSESLFRMLVTAYRKPPVTVKLAPEPTVSEIQCSIPDPG
jgi:hypothetical protein